MYPPNLNPRRQLRWNHVATTGGRRDRAGTHAMMRALIAGALALIPCSGPRDAAAQVHGTVVDAGGRPLPFVVVTTLPPWMLPVPSSGDEIGYRTMTDIAGRFIVPDTLIRRGTIWIGALGYEGVEEAVQPGDTIAHVMRRAFYFHGHGVRVGLAADPRVSIRPGHGLQRSEEPLLVGRDYEIVVSVAGSQCEDIGSTQARKDGNSIAIAVSVIRRHDTCTLAYVEREVVLPISFAEPGVTQIRIVGRWKDVVRTLRVSSGSQ